MTRADVLRKIAEGLEAGLSSPISISCVGYLTSLLVNDGKEFVEWVKWFGGNPAAKVTQQLITEPDKALVSWANTHVEVEDLVEWTGGES